MAILTKSTVVLYPGSVLCPACCNVLHRLEWFTSHAAVPEKVLMKCLNSHCSERGIRKWVPLERIEVEVEDVESD